MYWWMAAQWRSLPEETSSFRSYGLDIGNGTRQIGPRQAECVSGSLAVLVFGETRGIWLCRDLSAGTI